MRWRRLPAPRRRLWPAAGLVLLITAATGPAARAEAPNPLPIPWLGQAYCQDACSGPFRWTGRNNCGPASLGMVAEANGFGRPGALSRLRYVRFVKTLTEGVDNCGATSRPELDRGAGTLGLCARDEAWSTAAIEAMTKQCLPVVTFLDGDAMPWRYYPSFYAGSDHIVVTTGFRGSEVTLNDPLENSLRQTTCAPLPPDHENIAYGSSHRAYSRADFDAAAHLADFGWWGKAYGDALGDCDVPPCNPRPPDPGDPSPDPPAPEAHPFTRVTVRLASHCPDNRLRVYYVTDHTSSGGEFNERWSKGKTITNDGVFRTYTITFDGEVSRQYWRGRLLKLRIDPTQARGCLVAFSWIGVHDEQNRTARAWTFPSGSGSGGWWSRDTITTHFVGPFWAMHTLTNDPWIEHDNVAVDIGR